MLEIIVDIQEQLFRRNKYWLVFTVYRKKFFPSKESDTKTVVPTLSSVMDPFDDLAESCRTP